MIYQLNKGKILFSQLPSHHCQGTKIAMVYWMVLIESRPKMVTAMKRILIVDDSESFRKVVRIYLEAAGYQVEEGTDGDHALSLIRNRHFDLILSDVHMPGLDGISLLKEIRKLENEKFTPVVMITMENHDTIRKVAREEGARAWLMKPFEPEQLLRTVSLFLPENQEEP